MNNEFDEIAPEDLEAASDMFDHIYAGTSPQQIILLHIPDISDKDLNRLLQRYATTCLNLATVIDEYKHGVNTCTP